MTRLQQLVLDDFQGGINLRANQFHLNPGESPDMCNVLVDPRGGFYTRRGWVRWDNIADFGGETWEPRSAEAHVHTDDTQSVFVTNDGKVFHRHSGDSDFGEMLEGPIDPGPPVNPITAAATPHLADFGSWGNSVYVACGRPQPTFRHDRSDENTFLTEPSGGDPGEGQVGPGGWNNDYTNPVGGHAPRAEFCEPHAGYMFYANLSEDTGTTYVSRPTRLRWSHPGGQPEDFAFNDYIDIDAGGGQITGLMSFQDQLLIFKRDSLWALYGYGNDSWQLIKVSRHVGAPSSTAITRSESAVYFFSTSGRNAIFGYTDGQPVEISDQIRPAVEAISAYNNVWLGWSANLLICNLPVINQDTASSVDTTTFTFDLTIGNGAWQKYRMANASLGPIVEGTDVIDSPPLSVIYSSTDDHQTVMELGAISQAVDRLDTINTDEPFTAFYETGWQFAGYPDRRKSWRRPRHIVRKPDDPVEIRVEAFRDYKEGVDPRVHVLNIDGAGLPHWRGTMDSAPWDGVTPPDRPAEVPSGDAGSASPDGDGFDWDDGTNWAESTEGSLLVRSVDSAPAGGGFGKARSIKLRYTSTDGVAWGIDAIIMKYIDRRFTT